MKRKISIFLLRVTLLFLLLQGIGLSPLLIADPSDGAEESPAIASDENSETKGHPSQSSKEKSSQKESSSGQPEKGVSPDQLLASSSLTQAMQGEEGLTIQTMCTNCNEASLELGGLGEEHINVEMDGYKLFTGLPRIYAFSILPSSAISNIEISSGPGLAEDSYEAIGGTVHLSSHQPGSRPFLQVSLEGGSFGWNKKSFLADGKIGFLSGRLSGTQSHFDAIDADGDGNVETGQIDQWSGLAHVQMDLKRGGTLSLGSSRIRDEQRDGHGQLEKEQFTEVPIGYLKEDTLVDYTEYHLGYDFDWAHGHGIHLRATRYHRNQKIKAPLHWSFQPKEERYRIKEENIYGEIKWQGPIGSRWILSAGWNSEDDRNTVEGASMPIYLRSLKETVKGWGAFSQATVDLSRKFSLTFGTRYDHFDYSSNEIVSSDSRWSPRTSLIWKPLQSLYITTSFGYGLRPPRPIFNEVCCGQTPERNTDVNPERSRSMTIDLTYQPSPSWKFNTYLHRSDFRNYIIKMTGGSVDLRQKILQGNIRDATIQGINLLLSWKGSQGLSVSGSFSWLDAHNNGETVRLMPHLWHPIDIAWPVTLPLDDIPYIARRRAQFKLSYIPIKGFYSINVQAQYTGPMLIQHYFDLSFSVYPPVFPPGGVFEDYLKTPGFWLVNLSGKVTLKKHIELLLGVDNLFDYVQTDLDDFTTDYNWGPIRGRYFYAAISYHY